MLVVRVKRTEQLYCQHPEAPGVQFRPVIAAHMYTVEDHIERKYIAYSV